MALNFLISAVVRNGATIIPTITMQTIDTMAVILVNFMFDYEWSCADWEYRAISSVTCYLIPKSPFSKSKNIYCSFREGE